MMAEHSTSGVTRRILGPLHWLWCFLFGCLYYVAKGMWGIALISLLTLNGFLVILPIMNKLLVTRHYENLGWKVGST